MGAPHLAYLCPGCDGQVYRQTPMADDEERRPCPDCMPFFQSAPLALARQLAITVEAEVLGRIRRPTLARARALVAALERPRCHRGHEGTPLDLWDCPACVEEERALLSRLLAAVEALKVAASSRQQAEAWRAVIAAISKIRARVPVAP